MAKIWSIPTLHPAAIMRDQSMIPVVINDLAKGLSVPPEYYKPVPSLEEVKAFNATSFAFDIECSPVTQEIYMVGLCDRPYHSIVVPFKGEYIVELKRIFRNAIELICWNGAQFDIPILFPALGMEWTTDTQCEKST